MRSTNKILALLLSLAFVFGAFCSCETPEETLQSDKYVANVEITFASNDDAMKQAMDSMGNSKSTIYANGDDMRIETSAGLDDVLLSDNYVCLFGILYHEQKLSVGNDVMSTYEMAVVTDVEREKLLADIGTGASIDVEDFEISNKEEQDGNISYTCKNIKSDAKESLQAIYAPNFSAFDATVELSGAELRLETEKGRDKSSVLSCHFVILMNGQTYEITMHITTTYDYDADFKINAPVNIDEYVNVNYDEMFK
jgi:hypothetical protein